MSFPPTQELYFSRVARLFSIGHIDDQHPQYHPSACVVVQGVLRQWRLVTSVDTLFILGCFPDLETFLCDIPEEWLSETPLCARAPEQSAITHNAMNTKVNVRSFKHLKIWNMVLPDGQEYILLNFAHAPGIKKIDLVVLNNVDIENLFDMNEHTRQALVSWHDQ